MFTHDCLAMDFIPTSYGRKLSGRWDTVLSSGIVVHNKLSHIVIVEKMDERCLSSMCTR